MWSFGEAGRSSVRSMSWGCEFAERKPWILFAMMEQRLEKNSDRLLFLLTTMEGGINNTREESGALQQITRRCPRVLLIRPLLDVYNLVKASPYIDSVMSIWMKNQLQQ